MLSLEKNNRGPTYAIFGQTIQNFWYDIEGLGEMFTVDFTDMCAETFLLVSMGGQAECRASEERTPIGGNGNSLKKIAHFNPDMQNVSRENLSSSQSAMVCTVGE